MMEDRLNWLKEQPIAHRGLHTNNHEVPENTLSAFEQAIAHGYAIELDVQVIADQEVVIFHDDDLSRLCQKDKKTVTLRKNDLSDHPILRSSHRIPLLRDVLKLVNGRVPLLIEVKRQPEIPHANQIISNNLLDYRGPFAMQSFDPFVLRWFAKNSPHFLRGQLAGSFEGYPMNFLKRFLLKNMWLNFLSNPHFIAYDQRALQSSALRKQQRKGKPILAWTVTDPEMVAAVRVIADNIIFESFRP